MKNKIKNFFKNVGLFSLLLIISSPFVFLICWGAYELEQQYNVNAADDDTVITSQVFTGSQIILPATYTYGTLTTSVSARDVSFRFRYSYDPDSNDTGGSCSFIVDASVLTYSSASTSPNFSNPTITENDLYISSYTVNVSDLPMENVYLNSTQLFGANDIFIGFKSTIFDVSKIIGVTITPSYQNMQFNLYSVNVLEVRYFDSDGGYFAFYIGSPLTADYFVSRTYYFETVLTGSDGYQQGYDAGYNFGYSRGTDFGYQSGLQTGRQLGYNNGYNDGVQSANQYTFLSLIGAVIDAPLTAFTSLLNFNILGFNMLNLITGLFTLAVIIFIVRLVLGKG